MPLSDSEIKSAIKKILKKSPESTTLSQIISELAKELEYEESELGDSKKRIKSLLTEILEADSEKTDKTEKNPSKGKRKAQPKKKKDSEDDNSDSEDKPTKKRKEGNVRGFVVESESDNEEKSSGSDSEKVVKKKSKKGSSKKQADNDSNSKEAKQLKSICRRAFITIPKSVNSLSGSSLISKLKELLEEAGLSGKLTKEKVESFIEEKEKEHELKELLGTSKKLKIDLNAPRTMRARKQVNYATKVKIDSDDSGSSESQGEEESGDEKDKESGSEGSGKEDKE